MGQAIIFWVDEKAIRKTLQSKYQHIIEGASSNKSSNPATDFQRRGDINTLFRPIGNKIIEISKQYLAKPFSLDFDNTNNVFNYVRVLHSTDETLFMWTGNNLVHIGADFLSFKNLQTILELDKYSKTDCFLLANDRKLNQKITSGQLKWDNKSAINGDYGIYWIYEDYTRMHSSKNDNIVGEQFLNLMLSNWNSSKSILWHGNALNKVCSIIKPQFGFFIWGQNCLTKLKDIDTKKLLQNSKDFENE